MADEMRTPEPTNPPPQQQQQFTADASAVTTIYTNACRCNFTPEEIILDFGLNTTMVPNPNEPVKLTHRIVMNFYTAKRLMGLLMNIIQHHENNFGVLELDFQKRMRGGRPVTPSLLPKP